MKGMSLGALRIRIGIRLCLILAMVAVVCTSAFSKPSETIMLPMRDGVRLKTEIFFPPDFDAEKRYPTILCRTPYDGILPMGPWGVPDQTRNGYVVVIQKTRGRYGSEGQGQMVFVDDAWGANQDGYDTVEWIAKQEWSNGKVGIVGKSAPGIMAYLAAGSAPPHLTCAVCAEAASNLYAHAVYQGGAFLESLVIGWLNSQGFDSICLDTIAKHPTYDDFWRGLDLSTRYGRVSIPILHIVGWYDIFQQSQIDTFVGLQYSGGKGARGNQKIVIGPWTHETAAYMWPGSKPDDYLPPDGIPINQWLDYWLKGERNGVEKIPPVTYFTMGAIDDPKAPGNKWRTSAVWPIPAKVTPFYLHKDGSLSTAKPSEKSACRSYVFNPANPVPTKGGNNLLIESGMVDQRGIENRKDVLVFTTEPLRQPLEVTGRIVVHLWVSSSAKDTDFTAKLTDVYPDGRSMLIADGIIRARYRSSFARAELLKPGKPYQLEIDLWSTSIVFDKGHRIRLAVSSSNSPRFDVNPNTGELPLQAKTKQKARNTVYCDSEHAGALYLPIVCQMSAGETSCTESRL